MEETDAGQEGLRAGERRMSNEDVADTREDRMSDVKAQIAQEALEVVNGARRQAYGKPEQNFDRIAAFWMTYFRAKGWTIAEVHTGEGPNGTLDVQLHSFDNKILPRDVAAMMRLVKEARLAESPTHRDSYVDLVGYSLCGAEAAGLKSEAVEADASRLIEPDVAPRPFKVGDRVDLRSLESDPESERGKVTFIGDSRACVRWDQLGESWHPLSSLVHVD